LSKAGAQDPVIPFSEVVGKGANSPPEQIGATVLNVGMTFGFMVRVRVVIIAHCPADGVKV
jgi:hypothetical protein